VDKVIVPLSDFSSR